MSDLGLIRQLEDEIGFRLEEKSFEYTKENICKAYSLDSEGKVKAF